MSDSKQGTTFEGVPVPDIKHQAYSMLVENTGRALLDSGDAYGRNYERNASKSLADFEREPAITVDKWDSVDVSLFHWIVETLTVSEEVHYLWTHFIDLLDNLEEGEVLEGVKTSDGSDIDSGYYWHDLRTAFPDFLESVGFEVSPESRYGQNSYNGECFLSQTVQYERFTFEGEATVNGIDFELFETYVLMLEVHGGCDVRGGYTKPYPFTLQDSEDYAFEDFARLEAYYEPAEVVDTGQDPLPLDLEPVPTPEPVYCSSYDAGYSFSLEDGTFPFEVPYSRSNDIRFAIVDHDSDMSAEELAEEVNSREAKRLADKYDSERPVIYLQRCKDDATAGGTSPNVFTVVGDGGTVTFIAPSLEGW